MYPHLQAMTIKLLDYNFKSRYGTTILSISTKGDYAFLIFGLLENVKIKTTVFVVKTSLCKSLQISINF